MSTIKTILITGGSGNMGRGAVDLLASQTNHRIRVFARESERRLPVMRRWQNDLRIEFAWGDLTDATAVARAVDGADVVLHLGGLVSPLADQLPAKVVSDVNVGGTEHIVAAIRASPDRDRIRLVYIGSVAQTGSRMPPIHWGRTGDPIKVGLHGHYAVTKTQGEAVVADSGLRYWVSLRQSGMAHADMWRTSGPIVFHNPINGVFEWSTANDSARLMAAVCGEVPEAFWRNFYNIGGGASSRVVNHEFMASSMAAMGIGDFRKVWEPNWSATRNFHGQWYADSDALEALVPFRQQSLGEFFQDLPRHIPPGIRLFARFFPGLIRKQLKKIADGPGGLLHYVAHDDSANIRAYFGSRAAWERIPGKWDDFEFARPSRQPVLISHGYDEAKPKEQWTLMDLHTAAAYRGGKCLAASAGAPYLPVPWECAMGHNFSMSPNLYLKGGHWCPKCQYDVGNYDRIAARNPFFAQVWAAEIADAAGAASDTVTRTS